jgi:bacterioferritin-associated ferredoxin
MNPKRLVCLCNLVSAQEIVKLLNAGALTTAEIQKFTQAGTGCSRCVREIDAMIEEHLATNKKDPQLRIIFE